MNTIFSWVRRHPFKAAGILFLLWILPPISFVASSGLSVIASGVSASLTRLKVPLRASVAIGAAFLTVSNWFLTNKYTAWVFSGVLTVLFPTVGIPLGIWSFLDLFKTGTWSKSTPNPAPETTPESPLPDPAPAQDVSPSVDDAYLSIFGN